MGKKILMLAGDYAEDYETMVPFQALRNRNATTRCSSRVGAHLNICA